MDSNPAGDGAAAKPEQADIERTFPAAVTNINGRDVHIGNLEVFAVTNNIQLDRRENGTLKEPAPYLHIEKFQTSAGKSYRLMWRWGRHAWLAGEDLTPYRARYAAVAAGIQLAAQKGAHLRETGVIR